MTKEIRIGLLAIVALALMLWGYKYLLGKNLLERSQTFYVEYDNIDELKISDPVLINGFQIGTVQAIYLKPEDLQTIVVELNIERNITLPRNTVAALKSASMMGGKQIDLEYEGVCAGDDCLQSGDHLKGRSFGLIQSLIRPNELDQYVETVREGIGGVVDSVGAHLSEDANNELSKLLMDMRITVGNLRESTNHVNHLLGASSSSLVSTLDNLASITENIAINNEHVTGLLKNANDITEQLASARLDTTIFRANRALGNSADAIAALEATLEKADRSFTELSQLLRQINQGEGTLGSLAKDEALYTNLTNLSRNLELFLQDLRLNPKRYINVSIFGKKQKKYEVPEDDPALDTTRSQ